MSLQNIHQKMKKELFNLRHSSLKTAIERGFGILKNRFRSIDGKPFWSYETQIDVMLACCIIHNHIIRVYPYDFLMEEICSESEPINQFKSTAGKGRE